MRDKLFNHSEVTAEEVSSSCRFVRDVFTGHVPVEQAIILPVLYGCETWSLTLEEERRLRVSENRVLRRIFGPKRDEVTGEWRKLRNRELYDVCSFPNIIRVM